MDEPDYQEVDCLGHCWALWPGSWHSRQTWRKGQEVTKHPSRELNRLHTAAPSDLFRDRLRERREVEDEEEGGAAS